MSRGGFWRSQDDVAVAIAVAAPIATFLGWANGWVWAVAGLVVLVPVGMAVRGIGRSGGRGRLAAVLVVCPVALLVLLVVR
jgi:hypothetical protein